MIIARAATGDAIWFKATIDRIADILNRQGDTDTIDVRRSKAIGILAAEASRLLCQHQDDQDEPDLEEPDLDQHAAPEDGEEGTKPDRGADSGSVEDQPFYPASSGR
jgi:hypothetical protein